MTVKECYERIGGDYNEALGRMMADERVKKFAGMFLRDPSYDGLAKAMQEEDYDEAFRMAHTLKGVCQNLALRALFVPANELTEALREEPKDVERAVALLPKVTEEYQRTIAGIKELVQEL